MILNTSINLIFVNLTFYTSFIISEGVLGNRAGRDLSIKRNTDDLGIT